MKFTGERYVPGVQGNIELEHMHRYLQACEIVDGKIVLDIACGEGYGSNMLAQKAAKVFGVDISAAAVAHARKQYQRTNLEYREGSCSAIPLPDASVDIVVSYETIEHHDQHEEMMQEITRVLRPNGCLLISSPDKYHYSVEPGNHNQFHVKELYENEFKQLLSNYFKNINYLGQRVIYGSAILSESTEGSSNSYQYKNGGVISKEGLIDPIYWIAIASNGELPKLSTGIFDQPIGDSEVVRWWSNTVIERDAQIRNQEDIIQKYNEQVLASNQTLAERDTQTQAQQRTIDELKSSNATLSTQLADIQKSRSWRITAPLRYSLHKIRMINVSLADDAKHLYHSLPISRANKQKLKNIFFRIFGFTFKSSATYRRWKEYQKAQRARPMAWHKIKNTIVARTPLASLPIADGQWEWAEYANIKTQILNIKTQRRLQSSPLQIKPLNLHNESFEVAVAKIHLPKVAETPDVSIIIPVFNNLYFTLECLLSIAENTDVNISYEVIIADDASTDETETIISLIPNLRYIRNKENLGFLRNCNNALQYVNGQYVLYLNNDVQVTPNWLKVLLDTFKTHPKAGVVGPRFIYPNGQLQEVGAAFRSDGSADMVGLNEDASHPRFSYTRRVDYVSGACLLIPTSLAKKLGGFSEDYLPCYCEDSDLCLRVEDAGYYIYCNPSATIIHHLSKTTAATDNSFKMRCIAKNLANIQKTWSKRLDHHSTPRIICFYLPQFHPFAENNKWWGEGFTEWTNVTKAQPNFVGHYQPRLPADLGFYDLRIPEVMQQQANLAQQYGISGFCFYYYWFHEKRLMEQPIEHMLKSGDPNFPFCLCWANENWTRRWDGQANDILIAQAHSPEDDKAVILDLIRYFRDSRYIRIDGRPLILVYRTTLFPNFAETAERWRAVCREQGIGEIYITMVESFDLVHSNTHPSEFGCDAATEFPPQGLMDPKPPSGQVINGDFEGTTADYRDLAIRCATRDAPAYTRFRGVTPGWDNTARRQSHSVAFEHSTPGAFQAWLEEAIEQTRLQNYGDERIVFINAWNEWAEGAYLEPDGRFGHTYLEAVRNAREASRFLHNGSVCSTGEEK